MLRRQRNQLLELEERLIGKQEKNRRRTLRRQRERVTKSLEKLEVEGSQKDQSTSFIDIREYSDTSKAIGDGVDEVTQDDANNPMLPHMLSVNPKIHMGKGFFWQF